MFHKKSINPLQNIDNISDDRPVLIAGPTASGKSSLALEIAQRRGGIIVNADALQVFANWRVLTARPTAAHEALVAHHLYGHVPGAQSYSVGHWLRDIAPLLTGHERPIIIGGTGLYFAALTAGLADIPAIPGDVRAKATTLLDTGGLTALLDDIDAETLARIDLKNPMRVQRAWEVQYATGRGLADWQDATPAPLCAPETVDRILIDAERDWLADRIARRFSLMIENGALDEAWENAVMWDPGAPSAKAIGASELIAHVKGEITLDQARERAVIATRQYAKRQRTWFRARMGDWQKWPRPEPDETQI